MNNNTLLARLTININDEAPSIQDKSEIRPPLMPITLSISISKMKPYIPYNLYRNNSFDTAPDSQFNAHTSNTSKH